MANKAGLSSQSTAGSEKSTWVTVHNDATEDPSGNDGTVIASIAQDGQVITEIGPRGTTGVFRIEWTGTDPSASVVVRVWGLDRIVDGAILAAADAGTNDSPTNGELLETLTLSNTAVGTSPSGREFGANSAAVDFDANAAILVQITTRTTDPTTCIVTMKPRN